MLLNCDSDIDLSNPIYVIILRRVGYSVDVYPALVHASTVNYYNYELAIGRYKLTTHANLASQRCLLRTLSSISCRHGLKYSSMWVLHVQQVLYVDLYTPFESSTWS